MTDQVMEAPQSPPAHGVVASLDRVHDGKLHQGEKYENGADKEPNIYPFDVNHARHFVIDTLVQIDIRQPAACP